MATNGFVACRGSTTRSVGTAAGANAGLDEGTARPGDLVYFAELGSGPPLLLVHGVMVSGEMFQPIVAELARRHRVIIPDLRGHGRSRNLPPPYNVAQLASDLVRLLDDLGIQSTAVLGYSQGGAVAQQLALDHPARCTRLVLTCTYAFNAATFREKVEGRLVPLLIRLLGMRRFARLVISQGLTRVQEERRQWVMDLIAGQEPALMVMAWKEAMAFDSRRRLAEITCPTLVLAGSDDDAVPFHHAKMLSDGIVGSKLVVIDKADHALIWAKPEELLRTCEAFLLAS